MVCCEFFWKFMVVGVILKQPMFNDGELVGLLSSTKLAYPPLFFTLICFLITSPTQQCPQDIDFGQLISHLYLLAIMGTFRTPSLAIRNSQSSQSLRSTGLNLIDTTTAIPGAISPDYYFGYLIFEMTNYLCLRGVILILCIYFELLINLTQDQQMWLVSQLLKNISCGYILNFVWAASVAKAYAQVRLCARCLGFLVKDIFWFMRSAISWLSICCCMFNLGSLSFADVRMVALFFVYPSIIKQYYKHKLQSFQTTITQQYSISISSNHQTIRLSSKHYQLQITPLHQYSTYHHHLHCKTLSYHYNLLNRRQITSLMKTIKSPLKEKPIFPNTTIPPKKSLYEQTNNRSLRQNYDNVTQHHQRQHKKNSNSIKLVLKQLVDLKKELKDLKNTKGSYGSNQALDMSQCRKNNLTRKSQQSPGYSRRVLKSSSHSKSKSNSQKKQISTQTKRIKPKEQVNQFSFSVDSKSAKPHNKTHQPQNKKDTFSQSQQSQEQQQATASKKKTQAPTKRQQNQSYIKDYNKKHNLSDRLCVLQASQLYQKHISLLRHTFDVLQISSNIFSSDEKLNLNIELQRMSKNICRIPFYIEKPTLYYESIGMYARNMNNQLNNIIILLNRCDKKMERIKEKYISKNQPEIQETKTHVVAYCQKCEENQKKGLQKLHRRELKKFQKEIEKNELQLQEKRQQIKQLFSENATLKNEVQKLKNQIVESKRNTLKIQQNESCLKLKQKQCQNVISGLQTETVRQRQRRVLMQQDVKYYKLQIERIKQYYQNQSFERKPSKLHLEIEDKAKQLSELRAEIKQARGQLKQKQQIYQQIIKQKQFNILQLQKQKQNYLSQFHKQKLKNNLIESQNKQIKTQKQKQHAKIQDYYELRVKMQQKNHYVKQLQQTILNLQGSLEQQKEKNTQVNAALEICLDEINKLHIEVDNLQEANEKYKDKFVKTKILNDRISKRDQAEKEKKGETLQQINELIKHHRQNIVKNK